MVMELARPRGGARIAKQDPKQTFDSFGVRMYREAYEQGCNLSQMLERLDPTEDRPEGDRELDAFERVLEASGLRTASLPEYGIEASTWEEANATPQHRALLHEFAARHWRQASRLQPETPTSRAILLSGDVGLNTLLRPYADDTTPRFRRLVPPIPLERLVARTTPIRGDAYRMLYIVDDLNTDAYRMKRIAEAAQIPTTTLVTGEHFLRIVKFGRALRSTYEQLRRQRLDRIAFIIRRMALQAEVDKVSVALGVLIAGDGNANTAATVVALTSLDPAAVAGTLTMRGWTTYKLRFALGYNLDTILAQEASIAQTLLLPVSQGNQLPMVLMPAGALGGMRPMNDQLNGVVEYGVTADAPALKLVGFDSSIAIERVTEIGGDVSEVERYITNQTQILTMTEVEGYGVIDSQATQILNVNA